ncbi:MAG: hypothetical protein KQH83_00555 [Actinobacteria bacterium]|nr:hypothetical protein [Actinomycetota bacterium]
MVTRRARRWVQRGIAAALIAAAVVAALASWFTSEMIEQEFLSMTAGEAEADPSAIGLAFEQVDVPGPLGNYPAWFLEGDPEEDTWAVVVHDRTANRAEALDLLPVLVEHGVPVLVVTHRNDAAAPPADGGRHALGADEWEDVDAAVAFALDSGARDVVLAGYGTGGAAALVLARESDWADRVAGIVLDSPYLDPGAMVDVRASADNVPGFVSGWGKAVAAFRFGVDWSMLDQVAGADDLAAPVLLIRGGDDAVAPAWVAEAFAAARPGLIRDLVVPGAGHLGGFAADPARYEGAVGHFLRRVAVGPSGLPEAEVEGSPGSGVE